MNEKLSARPKQRAKLYATMIYELLHEIEELDGIENETAKEVHAKMMMLPEYWDM